MIEKNSNNIQCEVCGAPAIVTVDGHAYCEQCKNSQQATDVKDIQKAFKD